MSLPRLACLLLLCVGISGVHAREIRLEPAGARPERPIELQAGDTLVLGDGEWRDLVLQVVGRATAARPAVLRPATPGGVRLTGRGAITLAGAHVEVRDLHFDGMLPAEGAEALVAFRARRVGEASDSRLTGCRFSACNPGNLEERFAWVRVYGERNRVDHCRFEDMDFNGVTVQVQVRSDRPGHRIDHNHFRNRAVGTGNGFECIQIGQSQDSERDGACLIENNWFEACDGETEIISNKTGANTYRGNRFIRSAGTLTLRHGDRCVVEGNVFVGDGKAGTGGVRIIGRGHRVTGNHFEGLRGVTGGVVVTYQGIPESPLNGYFAADDAEVVGNRFVANAGPAIFLNGGEGGRDRTILPQRVRIAGNRFVSGAGARAVVLAGTLPDLAGAGNVVTADYPPGTAADAWFTPGGGAAAAAPVAVIAPLSHAAVGPTWDWAGHRLALLHPQALAQFTRGAEESTVRFRAALVAAARESMEAGTLYSVTFNERVPPSGDKRDYYSTGPYWWPNPNTPDGLPYVQIDGQFNPERDLVSDRDPLHRMVEAVGHATLAWLITGEREFGVRAAQLLETWFLDPVTGMRPNLNHAQAIPGRSEGRGRGIIDAQVLADLVDCVALLESSPDWTLAASERLRAWFEAYLGWLDSSPLAADERRARNNHGTAFDVQVAALAAHLGKAERVRALLVGETSRRVLAQIEPDGRQPHELARTRTWSYTTENLYHFYRLARIGANHGVNWLADAGPEGERLRAALRYNLPYVCAPAQWPHLQETAWQWEFITPVLHLARQAAPADPDLTAAIACLPEPDLATVLRSFIAVR